jgi:hypothetical protein
VSDVPDFGEVKTNFRGTVLTCRAVAPGLTLQDLVQISENAKAEAGPGDAAAGNPSRWPEVRGVKAVVDAVLKAIYSSEFAP